MIDKNVQLPMRCLGFLGNDPTSLPCKHADLSIPRAGGFMQLCMKIIHESRCRRWEVVHQQIVWNRKQIVLFAFQQTWDVLHAKRKIDTIDVQE